MDYQRIILLGNITTQAEVKQAQNGTRYTLFTVAVGRGKDKAVFFPVALFGKSVEAAGEVLTKGTRVLIEGFLDQQGGKFRVLSSTFCKV